MIEDPKECKVWCSTCNCYLYSVSIYEPISQGQSLVTIKCPRPDECEEEASAELRIEWDTGPSIESKTINLCEGTNPKEAVCDLWLALSPELRVKP